jgi:hypothetical protein
MFVWSHSLLGQWLKWCTPTTELKETDVNGTLLGSMAKMVYSNN